MTRIFPIEAAISRHSPYGGVTSPKDKLITPIIAKWIGCIPTCSVTGKSTVPRIMIAGIASMNIPISRKASATIIPVPMTPRPIAAIWSTRAAGILK
jgi:hypothetical protein